MKKYINANVLMMIFSIFATLVPITSVSAATEDGFGLDGKSFAIITMNSYQARDTNNNVVETSYLALSDSYNDNYKTSGTGYNAKRLGGKKVLAADLNCTNALTSCTTTDDGVTFWHFEINEEMRKKVADSGENDNYDTNGNKTDTLGGYFKWYNIYTVDASGNKKYLNLNFGEDGEYKVEISSTVEPVAVTKLNNGNGYVLWGYHTHAMFFDTYSNILIPTLKVGSNSSSGYNFGLFEARGTVNFKNGGDSTTTRNNVTFVLAEQGFETKTLSKTPSVVKNTTKFNGKISLFNYSAEINTIGAGVNGLKFYNGNNIDTPLQIAKDGYGVTYLRNGIGSKLDYAVEAKLGTNGYPATELGSFNYLFNDAAVKGKTIAGTNIDASSLLQVDEDGYYYYDSTKNAAYFDGKKFVLYDSVIRPEYTPITGMSSSGAVDYTTDERKGNFLPFNKVDESTISPYDITKTSTGINAYKLTGQNAGVPDLWFGLSMEANFLMPKDGRVNGNDMTFSFAGDDNVLVYIDGVLVLDYTGGSEKATINFRTGEVVDSDTVAWEKTIGQLLEDAGVDKSYISGDTLSSEVEHELKFFYIERGGNLSYFNLNTNILQKAVESNQGIVNPSTGIGFSYAIIALAVVALGALIVTRKFNKLKRF